MHFNWLFGGLNRRVEFEFDDYELFIGSNTLDVRFPGPGMTKDIMFGRAGPDVLNGGDGHDELVGGDGFDVLRGGAGMDHVEGGAGWDIVHGGPDEDTVRGGEGRDYVDEGAGHGDVDGGPGDDTLVGGRGADAFMVSPDSGDDVILDFRAGPGMFDHLALMDIAPEELEFDQTAFGVRIRWDGGSALLVGVDQSDLAQDDFMFTDDRQLIQPTDEHADSLTAVSFAKNEGGDVNALPVAGESAGTEEHSFDEFHVKVGSGGADTFQATAERDNFFGRAGDDRLFGGAEDDHLAGDGGADTLDGGDGMDDLRGGMGGDHLFGGMMEDNLMGEAGADTLWAGGGHDMIDGGPGDDLLHGGDGADAYMVRPGSGADTIVGGFDAGPGAFDHIAFIDILPGEVSVANTMGGALVSWSGGSVLIAGVTVAQMAQDDFMFSSVEGGGFVSNPAITSAGSEFIFI